MGATLERLFAWPACSAWDPDIERSTYRYGAQVDNVLQLQVVTGEGRLETCSATVNPDLFDACLAGLGQCGIIVEATLRLVPATTHTRVFLLFYPDLATMLDDERLLIRDGRFDHIVGYVVPSPGGWVYFIEATRDYTPPAAPDNAALLDGLDFVAPVINAMTFFDFADRVSPLIDSLKANGRIELPHPWFDVFVPDSEIDGYAGPILAGLTPDELARDLGSKKYVITAVPFSRHDWQEHYQPLWGNLVSAKRHFDPGRVLTPGPGIF